MIAVTAHLPLWPLRRANTLSSPGIFCVCVCVGVFACTRSPVRDVQLCYMYTRYVYVYRTFGLRSALFLVPQSASWWWCLLIHMFFIQRFRTRVASHFECLLHNVCIHHVPYAGRSDVMHRHHWRRVSSASARLYAYDVRLNEVSAFKVINANMLKLSMFENTRARPHFPRSRVCVFVWC